jgi:maleate isomerase
MKPVRLGMLTPSSNTVLEPLTCSMLTALPGATAHFSRFRVTEIGLSLKALAQFDDSEILRAAELLADARVDAIGWSGTSAGWLGFESDRRLCRRITAATGIPATTSILAMEELMSVLSVRRLGLVTPYTRDVQARIVANYAAAGIGCAAERHLGLRDNWSFAGVTAARVAAMVREVAGAAPDAVAVVCTNLRGADGVAALEAEIGVPILDSIAAVVWKSLVLAGADPSPLRGWGRLFSLAPGGATP